MQQTSTKEIQDKAGLEREGDLQGIVQKIEIRPYDWIV